MTMPGWIDGRNSVDPHFLLLGLAFLAALAGGYLLYQGDDRRSWREATAQVLTVRTTCEMTAGGYSYRRRPRSVVIACEDIEQFRRNNDGQNWYVTRLHEGQVRVTGADQTIVVEMGLGIFGGRPNVGERMQVVQNPVQPVQIARPDGGLSLSMPGGLLMGLGAFLAALAFFWF